MAKRKDQPSSKLNADLMPASEPKMNRRDFVSAVDQSRDPDDRDSRPGTIDGPPRQAGQGRREP